MAAADPQEAPDQQAPAVDPLEQLSAERDELKDRLLRQAAEMENYKKRAAREQADFLRRANEAMVKDILPVLDNLERALDHAQNGGDQDPLREGLSLIQQDLFKVLARHGLERVESLGQPFNPEFHEAMMQQEDPDQEENTVLTELQKGYLFQGRLLRPAMVVVSKRPAPGEDDGVDIPVKLAD